MILTLGKFFAKVSGIPIGLCAKSNSAFITVPAIVNISIILNNKKKKYLVK